MTQAPVADHPTEAVNALRAVIVAGEQLRHAIAAHYGIGTSETIALSHLRLQDGLSPHELAERVGLTPSTMTSLLDRLETAGFVRRSPHRTDRRRTIVTLTDTGEELLARCDQWLSTALGRLGPAALPDVTATLHHLAAALASQATQLNTLPPARHA